MKTLLEERTSAIHLLRAGLSVKEVAQEIERTPQWVRKWRKRYKENGWDGLKSQSRRPHRLANDTPEKIKQAIIQARSELESEAFQSQRLKLKVHWRKSSRQ